MAYHTTKPGLSGEYFNGPNFESRVGQRNDAKLDFDWGEGLPLEGVNVDHFSVRWTGSLLPEQSGEYTLSLVRDDQARVWLDDQLIIDTAADRAQVRLEANRSYRLRIEFVEAAGAAVLRLQWASPTLPQQVIPAERLAHDELVEQPEAGEDGFEVVGPQGTPLPVRSVVLQAPR